MSTQDTSKSFGLSPQVAEEIDTDNPVSNEPSGKPIIRKNIKDSVFALKPLTLRRKRARDPVLRGLVGAELFTERTCAGTEELTANKGCGFKGEW